MSPWEERKDMADSLLPDQAGYTGDDSEVTATSKTLFKFSGISLVLGWSPHLSQALLLVSQHLFRGPCKDTSSGLKVQTSFCSCTTPQAHQFQFQTSYNFTQVMLLQNAQERLSISMNGIGSSFHPGWGFFLILGKVFYLNCVSRKSTTPHVPR